MDIKLEKKPWYIRYRYYLIGGILFVAFLIYVITSYLGYGRSGSDFLYGIFP